MPETVNGIRVPSEGDPVDLPGDMQRFAEDVGAAAEGAGTTAGAAAATAYASTIDDARMATLAGNPASAFAGELSATIGGIRIASSVTYSDGLPSVETIPLATGGNLVKTYHWDGSGNPTTADWNYPTGPDYVETFTYDGDGNATGSTFTEA